jgi:hypothetical protein
MRDHGVVAWRTSLALASIVTLRLRMNVPNKQKASQKKQQRCSRALNLSSSAPKHLLLVVDRSVFQ